jgi:hypothetical protein
MSEFEAGQTTTGKSPCDCGCGDCGDKAKPALVEARPNNDRRKLLFGGVVATPAIVMLSSRSALATGSNYGGWGCTASAGASVNLSKPQATNCKSLSPGCWKNTRTWPSGFYPGLPDPVGGTYATCLTVSWTNLKAYFKNRYNLSGSSGNAKAESMATNFIAHNTYTATKFSAVIPKIVYNGTLMMALHYGSTSDIRHAAACILNAAQFGKTSFGYSVEEFQAMINARYPSSQLTSDLEWLGNDRGGASCPSDGNADSPSNINWPVVLGVSV